MIGIANKFHPQTRQFVMANEFVIKTGIIAETLMLDIVKFMYDQEASIFRQWKNISLEFVEIEKENLQKTLDEEFPLGVDWLLFPCEMSQFSANRSPNSTRISLVTQITSTYMLSTTPTVKQIPSLKFLEMQSSFTFYLLASLVIISALMSLIKILVCCGFVTLKEFSHQFLDNLWRICLLFFFEPLPLLPRILSWRIVVSAWLIAISFIYIVMCSHLNSKFTKTEFTYVDSVANLPRDRYRDVLVAKDYVEEGYVNRMAEIDEHYRLLKERMRLMDEEFLFQENIFSKLISTNIVFIVSELVGKVVTKELHTLINEAPPRGLVSFSEPLYSTFIAHPIARNASSRRVDAINGFCLLVMESNILGQYYNEMDFLFFGMKWAKPIETFQNTTFADIRSVLDVFFFGSLLAGLIFLVEFSTSLRKMFNFAT